MKVHRRFLQQAKQLQQTLSMRLSHTPLPISNPLWLQHQIAWHKELTTEEKAEQEAAYADESWLNSKPHVADMDTVAEMPVVNKIMSHIFDEPDKFAAVSGPLLATEIKNKSIVPRVPTKDLHAPKQITDALRRINATDPFLPSARVTPNREFAIVPRQRATTQLPPHMRLHEDISDSPEDLIPVETLVNAAILAFRTAQGRLPHKITIAAIRYWRYRISINTYNPDIFYYDCAPIPITHAPIGDIGINEVRLD